MQYLPLLLTMTLIYLYLMREVATEKNIYELGFLGNLQMVYGYACFKINYIE